MDILNVIQIPYFKKGNGIHIKKKNRGKFTEYCGGKVTQECIDKAKKSKNPTLRKRATFAENARKWKHQKGGSLYSVGNVTESLYRDASKVENLGTPWHNYDFTQSEEWANDHGYFPNERGHRDDRVKKETHPSHPSRGSWNKSGTKFYLSEKGMQDPNHTLFGLTDGGQDPQATLYYKDSIVLPEITVTPKEKYIHNTYDNIKIKFQKGGPIKRLDVSGLRNDPEYKKNFTWKMHDANLALIQDSLIARNADFPERVAILGQVIPESGGYIEDHGNGASGYVGWRGPRAVNLPKDAPGQAHKLMSEIYDNPTAKDWSHGGTGTGVQTGKEMMNLFLNTQNVQQAGKAFMKGYVRPERAEYEKRLQFLKLLKKYMK